jgi:hypothetical protein
MSDGDGDDVTDNLKRRSVRGKNAENQLQLNLAKEPIYMRISTYRSSQPSLYEQIMTNTGSYMRFYIYTDDGKWICWLSEPQRKNGAELPDDGPCYLYNYSDYGTTALPVAYDLKVILQNIKLTVAHVTLDKM